MIDRKKVIKGLERCKLYNKVNCDKCPYDYNGRGNGKSECTAELASDALAMLKEQKPKIGHWIFESKYCEAWSHTCSECGKRMTTGVGIYASFCWNCGAKMTGGDSIGSEIPNS